MGYFYNKNKNKRKKINFGISLLQGFNFVVQGE
jgi:hypothetical protein